MRHNTSIENFCYWLAMLGLVTFLPTVALFTIGAGTAFFTLIGEVFAMFGCAYLVYKYDDHADD